MLGYMSIDLDAYLQWYKQYGLEGVQTAHKDVRSHVKNMNIYNSKFDRWAYAFAEYCPEISLYYIDQYADNVLKDKFEQGIDKYTTIIQNIVEYASKFNQKIPVCDEADTCYLVKFGLKYELFPKCAVGIRFEGFKNYDAITSASAENLKSDELMMPVRSMREAKSEMDSVLYLESSYDKMSQDIKAGKCGALVDLQNQLEKITAELDAKKQKLLDELKVKQDELCTKKHNLEVEIEKLEVQIYTIRCYTGEVIQFAELRSGVRCSIEHPVIIHQKLRYLDEELGRLCALYDVNFLDVDYFENFISKNREAFDLFCPEDKCISLVRVARNKEGLHNDPQYANMLKTYEIYHGDAIGILIRDGESLHCGWVDPDHISFKDNVFYIPKVAQVSEEDKDAQVQSSKSEILSRLFLFNILQGCISEDGGNSGLINIPSTCNLLHPDSYIVYSSADNWVAGHKYMDFSSACDFCNRHTKIGDSVITLLRVRSESGVSAYMNDRGRGDKNIVGGLGIGSNELYKINMIDYYGSQLIYDTGEIATKVQSVYDIKSRKYIDKEVSSPVKFTVFFDNNLSISAAYSQLENRVISAGYVYDKEKVQEILRINRYVSVVKDDSDYTYYDGFHERKRTSCVNFLLESDEYFNIEVMNSAWLEEWIDSGNLGDNWMSQHNSQYRYIIQHLNTALKAVREREEIEKTMLIDAGFSDFNRVDWRNHLSEYKIQTGRHILRPRWAKQLAVTLNGQASVNYAFGVSEG